MPITNWSRKKAEKPSNSQQPKKPKASRNKPYQRSKRLLQTLKITEDTR